MDDPRPTLHRAADQIGALVTPDTPLDAPTPCEGWTTDDLLAHVVAVQHKFSRVGPGERPVDHPHQMSLGSAADYVAALAAGHDGLAAAWDDPAVLDRPIAVPWGTVPGREVGWGATQELVVHAWDLAAALGRTADLDPTIAEPLVAVARQVLPAEGRNARFGAPVPVPDDADPYTRLVAWLGRDPATV